MARVRVKRVTDQAEGRGGLADLAARAWTLAVARAGQDELGLPLDLREVVVERQTLAELVELLPDPALIAVLDEGSGQATGVAVLDAALTAGMVEALTTGSVSSSDAAPRRPTRTDAAMLAPVLDRALAGFESALSVAEGGGDLPAGFRFAALAENGRALALLLEEGPYRLLRARGVLSGGAREGAMILGLPEKGAAPARLEPPPKDRFAEELAAQVEGAPARLEAVLLRLPLPLCDILALEVGQEIALPQADIDRITLEGLDGRRVCAGKLGRQGGLRAVRLVEEGEAG